MCIIIAKPAGVSLPSVDTLKTCWDANPDGSGIALAQGSHVSITKGFMAWSDFENALSLIPDTTTPAMIIHFRIATHGAVMPSTCHPFPVTDSVEALGAQNSMDSLVITHNGIIHGMDTDDATSDTMAYIRDVMTPLRRLCPDIIHDENALDIIGSTIGSKMALIDSAGDLVTIGDFEEDNGVFYSNSSYKAPRFTRWTPTDWTEYRTWWYESDVPATDDTMDFNGSDVLPFDHCQGCVERWECLECGAWCDSEDDAREVAYFGQEAYII